jgi:hypothetical protein
MARVGNSIFDIQGKLGDLVYYRRKGKNFVRKVSRRNNNPTQLQLEHQAKFVLMGKILQPLNDFLKITYKIHNRNKTAYQKAFSENYHAALTGSYPSYSIDFRKLRLGNGTLPGVADHTVHSPEPGKLIFSWSDNDNWTRTMSSDQFYVAIYSEKMNHWIYQFECAERYKCFCRVDASVFSGTLVQIYIGFASAYGKLVSNPRYAGEIMVL